MLYNDVFEQIKLVRSFFELYDSKLIKPNLTIISNEPNRRGTLN